MKRILARLMLLAFAVFTLIPLMEAVDRASAFDIMELADIFHSRTMIGQGLTVNITVTVENHASSEQSFKATLFMDNFSYPTPEQRNTFCGRGDINRDGYIDQEDVNFYFVLQYHPCIFPPDPWWDPRLDLDKDGDIDMIDLYIITSNFGRNIWGYFSLGTVIGNQTTRSLRQNDSATVVFPWDTTGLAKGNYTLWAYATPIPCGIDLPEYTLASGTIMITMAGDTNNDGRVDVRDIYKIAQVYGSFPGQSGWNPDYDLNDDGKINAKDYYIVCKNYGKVDS